MPPSTIRSHNKKVPLRETAKQFADRVARHYHPDEICKRISEDVEKSRFSQHDWRLACNQSVAQLDHKSKEPRLLFCGAIYLRKCNNSEGKFSQS